MRRDKEWIYRCDHCGKAGRSASHISRHEKRCTKNPHRACGMCGRANMPIQYLIEAVGESDDGAVQRLHDAADGCPACMLAAIVQGGFVRPQFDEEGVSPGHMVHNFDYKAAKKEFWDNRGCAEGMY